MTANVLSRIFTIEIGDTPKLTFEDQKRSERDLTNDVAQDAQWACQAKRRGPIMDTVLSLLISVGIIAFGVWIVAGTLAAGSPLAWTLMGLLTVIVGLISLYGSVRE